MLINSFTLADGMAVVLWLAVMAFAVLGGADFGAGVWDLLARGQTAEQQRGALIRAIGPIWEANEIWLIFLVTGAWTAFPLVFSSVMTALFVPLTLGLLGMVMRGAAFAYYTHFRAAVEVNLLWGRAFSVAATVTPFFFGAVAAAAASGNLHVGPHGPVHINLFTTWLTPFGASVGCFAVALCACLAATYMTVEAHNQGMMRLVRIFRRRALISGAVAAAIGILAAWLASYDARYLFDGLTTRALPLALAAVVVGAGTAGALTMGLYRLARMLIGAGVALILGAWAVAQLPYLIVPDVKINDGAAPSGVQAAMLIATLVTMILVLPAIWYMLYLFKAENRRRPPITVDRVVEELQAEERLKAMERGADIEEPSALSSRLRLAGKVVGVGAAITAAAVSVERWRRRLTNGRQ